MDEVLQAQFARIEAALSTLVESIATYNPSTQAALDLVTADDQLSEGLDQLSYHQANHSRILALRAEREALEAQLKASVTTLATLRHELFRTPATTFPEDSRPVPINELLAYARKIASHTVPPTYRELIPPKASNENEADAETGAAGGGTSTNGLGTPAVSGGVGANGADGGSKESAGGENAGLKEVTEEQAEWIKKLQEHGSTWTPFPHNSRIWGGNLMAIQRNLLDFKKDPWKEKVDTGMQRDAEEQAEKVQDPVESREEPHAAAAPVRKESIARPAAEEKPRQFALFDDYEDEDD